MPKDTNTARKQATTRAARAGRAAHDNAESLRRQNRRVQRSLQREPPPIGEIADEARANADEAHRNADILRASARRTAASVAGGTTRRARGAGATRRARGGGEAGSGMRDARESARAQRRQAKRVDRSAQADTTTPQVPTGQGGRDARKNKEALRDQARRTRGSGVRTTKGPDTSMTSGRRRSQAPDGAAAGGTRRGAARSGGAAAKGSRGGARGSPARTDRGPAKSVTRGSSTRTRSGTRPVRASNR